MTALDDLAPVPFHDAPAPQRARMMSRLADTELAVALQSEPANDIVQLQMFPLEGGPVALACDSEERLAGFLGGPVAFAAMPGRTLAALLQTEGAGLLVNPGQPSEMLMDAAMLDWLTGALSAVPKADEVRLRLAAPAPQVIEALAQPLAERLADMRGLIAGAALAAVANGTHVILVAGADPAYQPAIAKALAEALSFLPEQPGGVDVSFTDAALPRSVLQFDLSLPEAPGTPSRAKGPPILR